MVGYPSLDHSSLKIRVNYLFRASVGFRGGECYGV